MEYQNITLSLPKDVLRRVKHLAIEEQTSVSGLLTKILEDFVREKDNYQQACQQHLALLQRGLNLGTGGTMGWQRADLHEL